MLISRQYKFILLSNPRCGSSTLREVLSLAGDLAYETIINDSEQKDILQKGALMWLPAYAIKSSIERMQDEESTRSWDDYYTFSTVRNPYHKIASWYYFLKPDKNFKTSLFMDSDSHDAGSLFHHHFNDFVDYLGTPDGERLKLPDYNYFCTDWNTEEDILNDVFKLEEIDETFQDKFKESVGFDVVRPLPKLNVDYKAGDESDFQFYKGDYCDLYNESSKALVAEWYASDIEKFNYTFDQ